MGWTSVVVWVCAGGGVEWTSGSRAKGVFARLPVRKTLQRCNSGLRMQRPRISQVIRDSVVKLISGPLPTRDEVGV